jgi:hypothetical protein
MAEQNLFQRLTKLFSSGPTIKRRVRNFNKSDSNASSAVDLFKKAHSDVYNSTLSAYGTFDRMARYSDFSEMESTPEIASALDIYAEETCAPDAYGQSLHVYSENRKIKELLETLFYDTLNIDFNLVMWVRNLCKYGDFFLFNDISPEFGIINAYPISITEMEREEGFDPDDPSAVRFRWITQGNQALENWQITHFRLLGNDAFLPYGSSVLESARRIWRQLILIEDAMLVYRVIRAPERRVFYIDVGNVPPEDVPNYIEQAKTALKRNQVVQKASGNVDLRYNPMAVDEDYYIPVRGGDSGTKIDTLAGGQNTSAIEDVEYIQKKLFAALKIPKAYLGYDEEVGSKATLAQEDIRFSRTIIRIQKTILAELNKMAMIHLYSHGFDGEELLDFDLQLSNPSSIAQQQKLELINTKFAIASAAPEGMVSKTWIRKNVMGFSRDEMDQINSEMVAEKIKDSEIEAAQAPGSGGGDEGGGDEGGGDDEGGGLFDADSTSGNLLDGLPTNKRQKESFYETDEDSLDEDSDEIDLDDIDYSGIKTSNQARNVFGGKLKKNPINREKSHIPDFASMTTVGRKARTQDSMNRPYDEDFVLGKPFREGKLSDFLFNDPDEYLSLERPRMDNQMKRSLENFGQTLGISNKMLSEVKDERENEFELDIEDNENE